MKEVAELMTVYLSTIIEATAVLVIAVALVKFLFSYLKHILKPDDGETNQSLRIRFGSALTVALELLLAADILATAIAPSWDDIGKLAAIAALRTLLNYFLERELVRSESRPVPQKRSS